MSPGRRVIAKVTSPTAFGHPSAAMASTQRAVMAVVAPRAGVSVMTVSRELNDFPGVAAEELLECARPG